MTRQIVPYVGVDDLLFGRPIAGIVEELAAKGVQMLERGELEIEYVVGDGRSGAAASGLHSLHSLHSGVLDALTFHNEGQLCLPGVGDLFSIARSELGHILGSEHASIDDSCDVYEQFGISLFYAGWETDGKPDGVTVATRDYIKLLLE